SSSRRRPPRPSAMPEEEPELSEAEASELVQRIEVGEDGIAVPAELLEEPEERPAPPPRNLYARILRMKIAEKLKLALRGNRDARAPPRRAPPPDPAPRAPVGVGRRRRRAERGGRSLRHALFRRAGSARLHAPREPARLRRRVPVRPLAPLRLDVRPPGA